MILSALIWLMVVQSPCQLAGFLVWLRDQSKSEKTFRLLAPDLDCIGRNSMKISGLKDYWWEKNLPKVRRLWPDGLHNASRHNPNQNSQFS